MADISDDIDDWSATAASNSPSGATSIGTGLDDNLRALQAAVKAWKNQVDPYSKRNYLINGGFCIAQRGTSFTAATSPLNSDDTYLLDRWTLLSDGNDIVDVTQNTATVPTGSLYSCALDVETANKKFGIIQFIEQKNAARLIGGTATLSFKARKGGSNSTVGTMRAAVLSWDGTADAVTSDVVSAWGISGTNPTLVANWTYENTPADLTLTTSFQTFSIPGISIDTASAKNIAVFLYYNNADGTVADFIYITDVQLEAGSLATEFEQLSHGAEKELCQRYALWLTQTANGERFGSGHSTATTNVQALIFYPTPMRTAPTFSVNAAGNFDVLAGDSTTIACTDIATGVVAARTALLNCTVAAGLTVGQASQLIGDAGVSGILKFEAEL
jgi:hypothetical protein